MIFQGEFWRVGRKILAARFSLFLLGSSALLVAFSLPPYDLSYLAWLSLVPFLVALREKSREEAFWLGFYWGVFLWLFTTYWSYVYNPVALPGIIVIMSCYSALFGLLAAFFEEKLPRWQVLTWPLVWVAIEQFRSMGVYGFPWNVLGYSQHLNLPLLQLASLGGVWLLSYLIVLCNVSLVQIFLAKSSLTPKIVFVCTLFVIGGGYWWGQKQIPPLAKPRGLKIAVVQADFSSDFKFHPENIDVLVELSRELKSQQPRLVVWTETAIINYLTTEADVRQKIFDLSRELNAYILVGAPNIAYGPQKEYIYYNSAFLITPQAEISGVYNKIHLVPFGEFLPLARRFKWIEKIEELVRSGGFTAGTEYTLFDLEGQKFGGLICYEGVFDSQVRRFVDEGAQFMVNITNDGWSYSKTSHYQHLAFAVFRAVENHIYFVRAGNSGVSAFIDPYGRMYEETPTYTRTLLTSRIGEIGPPSFYRRYGNVFMGAVWWILAFLSLSALWNKNG